MGAAFEPKTWEELAEDTYDMGTDGKDGDTCDVSIEDEDEDNEEE